MMVSGVVEGQASRRNETHSIPTVASCQLSPDLPGVSHHCIAKLLVAEI
jgi:hypothetical protein